MLLLLQRAFSLEIPSEPVHEVRSQCPALRLLRLWISEVAPNFLKTLFSLFVAL
jgi:hypothetical protein